MSGDALAGFAGILFDFDGVLVDSEAVGRGAWHSSLQAHGLSLSRAELDARPVGQTNADMYAWLQAQYGWTQPESFHAELAERFMAGFGPAQQIPGAWATLEALRERGVPFAVASNSSPEELTFKLRAAGLSDLVQQAFTPADVAGRAKPAPDLYQHAAAQLGLLPSRCLVIEDSALGVRAGVAARATVWGLMYTHSAAYAPHLWDAGASALVADHGELRRALGLEAGESGAELP
ncbi:HAD family hydrolase [Deinococcus lacus]|uniref:HAD family hydrolase n=1 Tax=Deinococcus lacus TaxID=392561 RepID=A0ABW1Y951_9DEIO